MMSHVAEPVERTSNSHESEFGIWSTGTSPSSKGLFVLVNIEFHSCSPKPSPIDQLENLSFAITLADKAEMCRRDFPLAVNKEGRRERIDSAILFRDALIVDHDSVVHCPLSHERLDSLPSVVVHRKPRTAKPRPLCVFSNSTNQGISTLHGPHQVAQKSTNSFSPALCS
jgi:hypothetical protein